MSNNNMLLKKSFKVRQLLDIFLNSKFFVLVHLEEYSNNNFENFRREMLENNVNLKLINKDDFFLLNMQRLGQGPTVLFFSEENFFDKFFKILDKNKINKQIVVLIKYESSYLTYAGYLQFKEKYNLSKSKLSLSILNSLNFHFYFLNFINKNLKNIFLEMNFIYKFHINKLILLLNLIKSKKNGNI
jgi:ribosomal protein L10